MLRLLIVLFSGACTSPQGASSTSQTTPSDPTKEPLDPAADCAAEVIEVADAAVPAHLQRALQVTLTEPAGVWVTCTPSDDPGETLLAESAVPASSHEVVVHGLYAGPTWHCEIEPACAEGEGAQHDLSVSDPEGSPRFEVTGVPSGAFTLLNAQGGGSHHVLVVDPEGRIRWAYDIHGNNVADVDAWWTGTVMHTGGGWGTFNEASSHRGHLRQVDLAGNVLFERLEPAYGMGYNHHSEPLTDGQILSLTTARNRLDGAEWYGVAVELLDPDTDTLTWSWNSQSLVDAGVEGAHSDSPWHANALHWVTDPQGDALWISLYSGQAVWRIDRATGARTHVLSADGDFTLVDTEGKALPASDWPYAQHGIDVTPDGRILMYDNGNGRPGGNYSRVVEYQLDLDARTATLLWSWTEPNWYTPIVGDADYLPNGHVLIAKGVYRFWNPANHASAVIEVDPATDEVVWRLEFEDQRDIMFRAHRYGGCEIFRSARHCDDVAQRVDALRSGRDE